MSWKKFTYWTVVFLLPVVIAVITIEILTRKIPSSATVGATILKESKDEINTLVLGASQNKRAINPEFLSQKTLNVAGTKQGYKADYYLVKDLQQQLPQLKRVILACTYRHFESPSNPKNFWKYRAFLHYYNVNAFERTTYFKDRLLFLSNPDFYAKQLKAHYINKTAYTYNKFGFQTDTIDSRFGKLNYNKIEIEKTYRPKYPPTSKVFLESNSIWFHKLIQLCQAKNLEIVISLTPVYDSYKKQREPDALMRRDSILNELTHSYNNIKLFDMENNGEFEVNDYLNENHLNARGAEKFTRTLDTFLSKTKLYFYD